LNRSSLIAISAAKNLTKAEKDKLRKKEQKARQKQRGMIGINNAVSSSHGKPCFSFSSSPLTPIQAVSMQDARNNSVDNEPLELPLLNLSSGQDDSSKTKPSETKPPAPQERNTQSSDAADSVLLAGKPFSMSFSHEVDLVIKFE
jgi:hypothetical protein